MVPFDNIKQNPAMPASSSAGLSMQQAPNTCAVHPSRMMGCDAWETEQARAKSGQETIVTETPTAVTPPPAKTSAPMTGVKKEVKEEQNKKGVDAMLGVYSGMLEGFGRYDGVKQYLTSTDLHCIFIDAKYPEGWVKHDWGMGSMLAEIISVKTGGCCNMQYCGIM